MNDFTSFFAMHTLMNLFGKQFVDQCQPRSEKYGMFGGLFHGMIKHSVMAEKIARKRNNGELTEARLKMNEVYRETVHRVMSATVLQTTVHLSDAGFDHIGGTSFYMDEPDREEDDRHEVETGLLVDAVYGRLVVNTGGEENLRCRYPVTRGVKVSFQVWWLIEEGEDRQCVGEEGSCE